MDNLKLLNIHEGISVPSGSYPPRAYHMFIFRVSGTSLYRFSDDQPTLSVSEGSMLFVPAGTAYTAVKTAIEESRYVLIRFDADLPPLQPTVFSLPHPAEMHVFFRTLVRRWMFGDTARQHLCYAMFYELLATITAPHVRDYQTQQRKECIAPGIAYLEQHIFDQDLTIPCIAACAGVSETYFRRIFHSIYGQSPKQYIQSKRLSQAQAILESGHFTSIQSVAAMVGYEDPLYFSRVFRQKYGVSPSDV